MARWVASKASLGVSPFSQTGGQGAVGADKWTTFCNGMLLRARLITAGDVPTYHRITAIIS
jgi:hypothetical protein